MTFEFKASYLDQHTVIYYRHLLVPEEICEQIKEAGLTRLKVTINSSVTTYSALISNGKGGHYIIMNKENEKKLKLNIGDEVQVMIEEDTSKYGMPMPEEYQELLNIDDEGLKYFESLTPGKRRNLIHLISKPKSSQIRLTKALIINDYLKLVKGKLDFKELNTALKEWRDRY